MGTHVGFVRRRDDLERCTYIHRIILTRPRDIHLITVTVAGATCAARSVKNVRKNKPKIPQKSPRGLRPRTPGPSLGQAGENVKTAVVTFTG